jgi:hypothetical protein
MSERKHSDLWRKLDDEAGEDEIDRAASVSEEQAEADLKAAGFDVAAERAKANAFLDALENGPQRIAPDAMPQATMRASGAARAKRRVPRRFSVAWLAGAATAGGIAGGALVTALQSQLPVGTAPSTSVSVGPSTANPAAADLRRRATAACDAKQWSLCLADLDKARAADPAGDDAPAVKSLRNRAIDAIEQNPR